MISEQERQSLVDSIDKAIQIFDQMKSLIIAIEEKRYIVEKIIFARSSNISLDSVENQIETLIKIASKLEILKNDISEIKSVEDNITDAFKAFIQKEFVLFPWGQVYLADSFTVNSMKMFLQKQTVNEIKVDSQDDSTIKRLCSVPDQYSQHILLFEQKISSYKIFAQIKSIHNNIVMVGANGSGKSSFARYLNGNVLSHVSILSAQHLLVYRQQNTIPASDKEIMEVRTLQKNSKMSSDSNFIPLLLDDMDKLIIALIADNIDKALDCYEGHPRETSFLEKTIAIWQELIEHRKLVMGRSSISAKISDQQTYPFNNLSDGEKAVFYYIGHVLLIEPNSYIIVDEPENHLHMAICNKLWDKLEQVRTDCKFIYLTHNLDFASSRTNATIIWNKNFTPPNIWDFQIIENNDILPKTLLMEVLGSRKGICFCEGDDKSSLDYKLYSILFPEYTIIPVGGHLNVINYTKAYNELSFKLNQAVGIIDGDYHSPKQIAKWEKQHIYALPVNEIENLLCDLDIVQRAVDVFLSGEDAIQHYYEKFWKELDSNKEKQVILYINNIINNRFKENFLHEKKSIEKLKKELLTITSEEEIDDIYEKRLKEINDIICSRKYEEALAIVNFKGKLINDIARHSIVDNYPERILGLIKRDSDLKILIRNKYFLKLVENH